MSEFKSGWASETAKAEKLESMVLASVILTQSFSRWTKTGFIKAGRINMWYKGAEFNPGDYVYNRETHQFFKKVSDEGTSNEDPFPHGEGWEFVDESSLHGGLNKPEIVISVTKGDAAIRPLYHNQ